MSASIWNPANPISVDRTVYDPTLFPWLADPTGVNDSSDAINACSLAAGAHSIVRFPPKGIFKCTKQLKNVHSYQTWECKGAVFSYEPTANGTFILFKDASAGSLWFSSLEDAFITSSDSTYTKTAVELYDVRGYSMPNLVITSNVSVGGVNTWTGGTGSIGVHIKGRELFTANNTYISADLPIRISQCPNTALLSFDVSLFTDTILIANGNPKVVIDDGVILTQSGFKGRLSMNRGTSGIYWHSSTAASVSNGLFIENIRSEQEEDPTAYVFDIEHTGNGLQSLSVTHAYVGNTNGMRLRGCDSVALENYYHGITGTVALNVDSTVSSISAKNCFWQTGSTVLMTGQRMLFGSTKVPNSSPLPKDFIFEADTNVKRSMIFGGAAAQESFTLANNGILSLGPAGSLPAGFLLIVDERGIAATFIVLGSQGSISEISDPTSGHTTIAGNATTTNIYWSAGNLRYELENKTGASRNYKIMVLGSYGAF